jgi:hypothetical protein
MRRALVAIALAVGCARGSAGSPVDSGGSGGRDGSSGGSDSSIPIDAAIDGNGCATQPCDIATQCGCGTTQACDINSMTNMGTACRDVTTPGTITNTCASATDCARGYVCVGDGTHDDCEKYCQTNADCTAPRGQCVIQLTDPMSNPIAGAVVCSSNCNPAAVNNATTCPTGWSCDLFTAMFNGATDDIVDCRKAGTAGENAACSATVACAAGFSCVNNGTSDVCARICQPAGGGPACPGVTSCLSFQTPFVVGGTEYGVCL